MITSNAVRDHAQLEAGHAPTGAAVKEEAVYIKEELPVDQNEILVQQDGVKDEFIAVKSETDFLQCFGDVQFALGGASASVDSMFLTSLSEDDFSNSPGNGHLLGPGSPEGGATLGPGPPESGVGLKLEPPQGMEMLGSGLPEGGAVLEPPEGDATLGPGPPESRYCPSAVILVPVGPPERNAALGLPASRRDVDAAVHVKIEPPCAWSLNSTGSTLKFEAQMPFCDSRKVRRKLKHNSDTLRLSVSPNHQESVSANEQESVSANQQEYVSSSKQEPVSANQQDSNRNPCAHGDDAAREKVEWEECLKGELVDDPSVMPHSGEFTSNQNVDSSEPNLVPKYNAANINYNFHNGNLITDEPHLEPKYATSTNFTSQNSSLISDEGLHSIEESATLRTNSAPPKSNMNASNTCFKRPLTQPDHTQASKQPKLPQRRSYQCKLCSFSCNALTILMTHSKDHKKGRQTHLFECRACDFSCSDMKVFLAHTTDVCKVVSKNPASSVRTKGAPSSVRTYGAPSSVRTYGAPSSVRTYGAPSSVRTYGAPSSVRTKSTPSSDGTKSTPSSDGTKSTPSSDGTKSTPSSDGTKSTPSSDGTKSTPSSDGTKSTPSSDGTKSTPSSEGTKSTSSLAQTNGSSDRKAVPLLLWGGKNQAFCCEYCDFETHNSGFILRHVALHIKEARRSNGFECSLCDYKCGDRDQFLLHVEAHNSLKLRATGDPSLDLPRLSPNIELSGETTFLPPREKNLSITKGNKFKLGNSRICVGNVRTMASTGINYSGNSTDCVTLATSNATDRVTMATENATDLVTMATGNATDRVTIATGNATALVTMTAGNATDLVTMAMGNATDRVTMETGSGAVTNSIVNIRQQGKMGMLVGSGVNEMLLKGSVRDENCRLIHTRKNTTCTPRGAHDHDYSRAGVYACTKCPYTCTSARTFRVHLAQCGRLQKQARDTDDFLQCSRCSFKTKDTKWFLGHVQGH